MYDDNKVTYFGETDFRNKKTKFGIRAKDRSKHMYVIGKTGMGKSTLLENMAIQDIQNDEGLIFIDPHGSTAVKLLEYIPRHRIDDVVYFAPHDTDFPISFNVLEQVPREKRNAVSGGLISTFKKIWVDSFSSRMEYLLNYALLALLDVPGTTLLGINRLLSDKVYRKYIIDRVEDSLVKNFWTNEFDKYTTTYASEAIAPIQNKVGQFIASPMIRNIIGQEVSSVDFRTFMDQKKIVIINISKGIIGPENMRLLGGMLITKIQLAAMSRANLSDESLGRIPNTYLYVDEFQNFANESFAEILSESRKYKLCLTVANQYVDQMTEEVRNAVIGNVGTFIAFRVGSTDAELMEREFAPYFTAEDMVNLGFTQMYLKLMIDGIGSKPFSANSLPPIPKPGKSYVEDIVAYSRKYFAGEKEKVEAEIKKWTNRDFNLDLQKAKQPKKDFKEKPTQEKSYNQKIPTTPKVVEADSDEVDEFDSDLELVAKGLEELKQSDKKVAELKVAKEIKQIISEVEKEEKLLRKRDEARLRALNTQKQAHANKSFVDTKRGATFSKNAGEVADEIPEDVLRALLDMDKI
jgi:energy-coupling factor transporter ATP-binding protein EcfA2